MLGVPQNMQDGDTVSASGGRLITTTERGAGLRVLVPSILSIAGALTAPRTATFPDRSLALRGVSGTQTNNRLSKFDSNGDQTDSLIADAVTGNVLSIAGTLTAPRTITLPDSSVTIPSGTLLTGTLSNANRLDSTSAAGVVKESQIADAVTGNVLSIAGTLTVPRTQQVQDAAGTIPLLEVNPVQSFRNKIINGDLRIWQRGTSAALVSGAIQYLADRIYSFSNHTGATITISQQPFTLGTIPVELPFFFRYAQTVAGSGGTATYPWGQRVEDVRTFAGKRIVVSFWAKADAVRTITPSLAQIFGTGGSPSGPVTTAGSAITLSTAWAQYAQAITVPSITGKTIGSNNDSAISIDLTSASNVVQTFDLCMVEAREAPTVEGTLFFPWELRPLQVETALCHRYYQSYLTFNTTIGEISLIAVTANTIIGSFSFKVPMRAAPSVSFQSQGTSGGAGTVRNASTGVAIAPTTPTIYVTQNVLMSISGTSALSVGMSYDFGATFNAEFP